MLSSALGIPDHVEMAFRYHIVEFNTSIKPWCFRWLAEKFAGALLYYFDPDILVYDRLHHIDKLFEEGADLVLTPHVTSSLTDGKMPDDLTIMKSGIYNLGFAAFRAGAEDTTAFLPWWSDRLRFDCLVDIPNHRFTDQRWMDFAPAFVRRTGILHHPGYNCAYWNLKHRRVVRSEAGWAINGDERLYFYHFSGYSPGKQEMLSKHQNRVVLADNPDLETLFVEYTDLLYANEWRDLSREPYGYGAFASGRPIHPAMRRAFLRAELANSTRPADPFSEPEWFDAPDEQVPDITRIMHAVWDSRPDVQRAFPLSAPDSIRGYATWFIERAALEERVDGDSIRAAERLAWSGRAVANLRAADEAVDGVAAQWIAELEGWLNAPTLGPATEAGAYFSEVIETVDADSGASVPLSRGLLLLLVRRPDLQRAFLGEAGLRAERFVLWLLTAGLAEAHGFLTLPPALVAWLHAGSSQETPSRLSCLLARLAQSEEASLERGSVAKADWWRIACAGPAIAERLAWPSTLLAPVFASPSAVAAAEGEADPPLSWVFDHILLKRPDVANAFDPATVAGRRALLNWFLIHGSQEMHLPLSVAGADLRTWLDRVDDRRAGIPNALALLWEQRLDLRRMFALNNPESGSLMVRWFATSGISSYDATALGEWWRQLVLPYRQQGAKARRPPTEDRVYLVGPGGASGRAEDVRMTARALDAVGIVTEIVEIDVANPPAPLDDARLVIAHWNADTALVDQERLARIFPNAYRIGYWAWELARFPRKWAHAFAVYDEVWSSTEFSTGSIAAATERPVVRMPMAVALPEFDRAVTRRDFDLPEDRFCFLFTFDFKSYHHRKNPAAAIAAFREAFQDLFQRVFLLIKTSNADADPEGWSRLKGMLHADSRIEMRDFSYSRTELCQLVNLCDCFVSPHRSEGFGRGPAEAMLLGKPVIVTAYSGNMDYTTKDNAFLVDFDLIPIEDGQYNDVDGQVWAEIDVEGLAAAMRQAFADKAGTASLARRGRADVEAQFGAEAIGTAMADRLAIIHGETERQRVSN